MKKALLLTIALGSGLFLSTQKAHGFNKNHVFGILTGLVVNSIGAMYTTKATAQFLDAYQPENPLFVTASLLPILALQAAIPVAARYCAIKIEKPVDHSQYLMSVSKEVSDIGMYTNILASTVLTGLMFYTNQNNMRDCGYKIGIGTLANIVGCGFIAPNLLP